jgi:hypothetical protein
MKGLILAALAVFALAGCVAVPYGGDPYYAAPAVGVGVYSVDRHHHHHRRHQRHHRRW